MDDYTLANKLFGTERSETGKPNRTISMVTGVAVEDSKDGLVKIDIGGNVTGDDPYVYVPTGPSVYAGDIVQVLLAGPLGKTPFVANVAGWGDRVAGMAEQAEAVAEEAKEAAEGAGTQFFWQNESDPETYGGSGVHVTNDKKDDWVEAVADDFPDLSDEHPHHNILINSLGILLRRALNNLVSITRNAIAFYDGLGNNSTNIVATFGASGAQIGKSNSQHAVVDSNGLTVYNGDGTIARVNSVDVLAVKNASDAANILLDGMKDAAEAAGTTLNGIYADAEEAKADAAQAKTAATQAASSAATASQAATSAATDAASAKTDAAVANQSASGAKMGLSEVERVVGTLNWISEHGSYELSGDTQVDDSKIYYERSGSGTSADPYKYEVVEDPQDADVAGYYVLIIDESVQNYLASHLAQTDYGLDLMVDGSNFHMHIGTVDGTNAMGTYIIDAQGSIIARFDTDGVHIGKISGGHTEMTTEEIKVSGPYGNNIIEGHVIHNGSGNVNEYVTLAPGSYTSFLTSKPDGDVEVHMQEPVLGDYSLLNSTYDENENSVSYEVPDESPDVTGDRAIWISYYSQDKLATYTRIGIISENDDPADYSFAAGFKNVASGEGSIAIGSQSTASGRYAASIGRNSKASGLDAFAAIGGVASSSGSAAIGRNARASGGESIAVNSGVASGPSSFANGSATASGRTQTAIGRWNIEDDQDQYVFIIGNGTRDYDELISPTIIPANAFTVDWDGNTVASGEVSATDVNDVVHNLTEKANKSDVDRLVTGVSGVKGNAESTYRTGNVNITPANIGAAPASLATISGSSQSAALKARFNGYKSSTPRNQLIDYYSSAMGTGALAMGYFLNGYDTNPYGGFFVCHYNTPRYVGIAGGTYTDHLLISDRNYTTYCVPKRTVLYNNTTGTTGTVSLSASAANYNHMRIYYRANDANNQIHSTDVYSPNGKVIALIGANPDTDGVWINCSHYTISGTSMTRKSCANGRASGNVTGNATAVLQVIRVEVWNE